jgi:hypothetical protein
MSIKSTMKWIWEEMGRSDKQRRRNALILIVIAAAVLICGFYSGAIQIAVSKAFQ